MHSPEWEAGYTAGKRAVLTMLLNVCLQHLGPETAESATGRLAWMIERDAAIRLLRTICADYGDTDWQPTLHLAEILEKHLLRHLEEEAT